jgi:hypothetical protein
MSYTPEQLFTLASKYEDLATENLVKIANEKATKKLESRAKVKIDGRKLTK